MTVYIRKLTVDDAGALFALVEANREFLTPWIEWAPMVTNADMATELLQCRSQAVFGAWEDLRLVGACVLAHEHRLDDDIAFGCLLDESRTGRGLALRLFDFACGSLVHTTIGRIRCEVSSRNVRSIRYVQKCGFAPTGKVDGEMVEYARRVS